MEEKVDSIIEAGNLWTDPDFKPVPTSLWDPKIDKLDGGY